MIQTDAKLMEEIEARRVAAGISIEELCQRAAVADTTFGRQKAGVSSVVSKKFRSIVKALEALERERGIVSPVLSSGNTAAHNTETARLQ